MLFLSGKNKDLGARGEDYACKVLRKKGYKIIDRNVRFNRGELDIIARKKGVISFVEVKTRSGSDFGGPAAAITPAKQKKLTELAMMWLDQHNLTESPARFDVVALLMPEGEKPEVEIIENAFEVQF